MAHFDNVLDAQKFNMQRRAEVEAASSIYPNDKLRVRATRYQRAATRSGQIVHFRPTEIIDDPHRIRIMDELGIEYVVMSKPKRVKKDEPVAAVEAPVPASDDTQAEKASPAAPAARIALEWTPKDGE